MGNDVTNLSKDRRPIVLHPMKHGSCLGRISILLQSLLGQLSILLTDDEDDEPKMPMISMQKQTSLRANQTISPMYFLMPK